MVSPFGLLSTFALFPFVAAFTFTTNQPTICGPLEVEWTGGQPPFTLNIYPINGTQTLNTIPDSAFSNGKGSFSTSFNIDSNNPLMIAVMSDATGFATGGISPLITAQKVLSDTCTPPNPTPAFFWGGLNQSQSSLQQCHSYGVQLETTTGNSPATLPVTIALLVPGGSFQTFTMTQNTFTISSLQLMAGTTAILALSDAQNRSGGVSDLDVVQATGDDSCLTGAFPSSTVGASASSSASFSSFSATSTSRHSTTPTRTPQTLSGGAIGGIAAGGAAVTGAIAIGVFLCLRRRRRRGPVHEKLALDSPSLGSGPVPDSNYAAVPFMHSSYELESFRRPKHSNNNSAQSLTRDGSGAVSGQWNDAGSSNVSASGTGPQRYVQHTDLVDDSAAVIELPPQYDETRRPIPGMEAYRPGLGAQASPAPEPWDLKRTRMG